MFSKETFTFLEELAANNDRAWFEDNKSRYEAQVREPALQFIDAMEPVLARMAPQFRAEARKVGGSLMRVFRDTRFSRDKTPYKTNIGIQFRHALGKDVHAPGFYVHIACDECFLAVGCWHPDPDALGRIRDRIAEDPQRWFAVRDNARFTERWGLSGDSLSRPPRGHDPNNLALVDLKRKDFIGVAPLSENVVIGAGLVKQAEVSFGAAVPFMKFLCDALGVAY